MKQGTNQKTTKRKIQTTNEETNMGSRNTSHDKHWLLKLQNKRHEKKLRQKQKSQM